MRSAHRSGQKRRLADVTTLPRRRSPQKHHQTVQNRPAIVIARKPLRKPYATYKPANRTCQPMEIGLFQNATTLVVKLMADSPLAAAAVAAHIGKGAPPGVSVTHEATVVSVTRSFDTEADALAYADELTDGIKEGHLFNITFDVDAEESLQ